MDRRILELVNSDPFAAAYLMEAKRRGETESFAKFQTALMQYKRDSLFAPPSIARIFATNGGARGELDGSTDQKWLDATARRAGAGGFTPGVVHLTYDSLIPSYLRRDLNTESASQGGYLASTQTLSPADILRPWSLTRRTGVTIEDGSGAAQARPAEDVKPPITWQANESAQISTSTPTIGERLAVPKLAFGLVTISGQLLKQANAEDYIRRSLLGTAGTAIDQAVLQGSGASGQPTGVPLTTGIGTQSGTSLARSGLLSMRDTVAAANGNDERITFISTPAVRTTLAGRETVANTGLYLWQNDRLVDRSAFVTTDMAAGTLICADWSCVTVILFGGGLVVEFDPFSSTNFQRGTITARVTVAMDLVVMRPGAFVVASSVT